MNTSIIRMNHFIEISKNERLRIVQFAHYAGKVRRNFPYHQHDYYEISFTFHGDNLLILNGNSYPFASSDICMVAPETIHGIALPSGSMVDVMNDEDDVWEIDCQMSPHSRLCQTASRNARIVGMGNYTHYLRLSLTLLSQILCEQKCLTELGDKILAAVYEVLLLQTSDNVREIPDLSDDYMREILLFIYDNWRENLTLDFLTKKFSISRSHLIRLFNQNFGIPPISYRIELQICFACNLLLHDTSKGISEISEELGFENVSYFSLVFSRRMKLSPQKFRQKYRDFSFLQC